MSSQIIQSVAVGPATAWAISHRGHGMHLHLTFCLLLTHFPDFENPNEDYWYTVFVGRVPGVHPKGSVNVLLFS